MITPHRTEQRHHQRRREQEVWNTFPPGDLADANADGLGALELLSEHCLPPGAALSRHRYREAEVVTYVREGALAHEDSMGFTGVIHAGEFERMTVGRALRHSEANASRTEWAHVFQVWLRPAETGLESSHQLKRFSAADRRAGLCLVASPDARRGSLRVHLDGLIYSAMLSLGQHVVYPLSKGRSAWLHLVRGKVTLGDLVLAAGDGAGLADERSASFTAREEAEILLLDLGVPKPPRAGGVV